jgi:Holliday junction resolvase RusA-like endonuclease
MIYLRLPVPPSTNNLYLNIRRGRTKSKAYREWIEAADNCFLEQRRGLNGKPVAGPYTAQIKLPRINGDVDNRTKAILDWLVRVELTTDDRHCRKVSAEIDTSLVGYCEVTVEAA